MPVTAKKKSAQSNASKTAEKLARAFEGSAAISTAKIKKKPATKKAAIKSKSVKKASTAKKKPANKKPQAKAENNFQKASDVFGKASRDLIEIANQGLEQNMDAAEKSLKAKDASSLFAIQNKLFQQNLENCIKQAQKLNEIYLYNLYS